MSDNQPFISQINLSEGGVEIVYVEPRDTEIADRTGILNTKVKSVPRRWVEEELADLIDAARALIDHAAAQERNAPDTFHR